MFGPDLLHGLSSLPGLRPRVQRRKSHSQPLKGCYRGPGRESFAPQPPGSVLPASLPAKCKALLRPRPAGRGSHSLGPRGHGEPLAVRLYGPPLRPAEASPSHCEASIVCNSVASSRIPPRGYLASISLRL